LPPHIVLCRLRPPQPDNFDITHGLLTKPTFLPTSCLPLLQLLSCWDFDDSRGVFIMGTSDGDVCLASFIEETAADSRSFVDDLPQAERKLVSKRLENMKVPIHMDLPAYYQCRNEIRPYHIPAIVIDEATRNWTVPDEVADRLPIAGWSNDWTQFREMHEWVFPTSRWGPNDADFTFGNDGPAICIVRDQLNIIGDIIPVLYSEDDHNVVIFRVGRDAFIHSIDFDGDDCIGIIPMKWEDLLTEERLRTISDDISIIGNLDGIFFNDYGLCWRSRAHHDCRRVLKFLSTSQIGPRPHSEPETWAYEDWLRLELAARTLAMNLCEYLILRG